MNEMYTREEVEYMMRRLSEKVYEIVFRVGYISNEERRVLIQHLLKDRK